MDIIDLLKLVNAGFTAEQIGAMTAPKEEQNTEEPNTEEPNTEDDRLSAIENSIQSLKTLVMTQNIMGSSQPNVETVDDILAKVINPPRIEKEK